MHFNAKQAARQPKRQPIFGHQSFFTGAKNKHHMAFNSLPTFHHHLGDITLIETFQYFSKIKFALNATNRIIADQPRG